jgi:hypothetical protein
MPPSQRRHALAEAMGSAATSRPGHNDRRHSPYRHAALNQRAGDPLLSDKSVGRRDTAYLLLAASKIVDSKDALIGSPALQVHPGAAVGNAFPTAYESNLCALWHHTLRHACEAAGLSHANSAEHRHPRLNRSHSCHKGRPLPCRP